MSVIIRTFLEEGIKLRGNQWVADSIRQIEKATGFIPEVLLFDSSRNAVTIQTGGLVWQQLSVKRLGSHDYVNWFSNAVIPIDRFVVDTSGEATPFSSILHSAKLDRLFIRKDGWVLACNNEHLSVARSLWEGDWLYEVPVTEELRQMYLEGIWK